MAALKFDKCCFCIDLKTGCFIIGYLSLVVYLILAVTALVGLLAGVVISKDASEDPENKEIATGVIVASAILLLITVVLLTFIIVLLVGLHKNKPGHVKAYLIYYLVYIIIMILQFIAVVASGSKNGQTIAQNIIGILLSIYFLLVLRSQYLVMKTPERGPAIYNAA